MNDLSILLLGIMLGIIFGIGVYRRPKEDRARLAFFYSACFLFGVFIGEATR